jgi:hypothetical protein
MQSSNAILLKVPYDKQHRHPRIPSPNIDSLGPSLPYDDNGVDAGHICVPHQPAPFEYRIPVQYDLDGDEKERETLEDMRSEAEMYHRIKF